MSVKTGRAVNELLDALLGVPMLSRITSNAFYTGFIAVIIIVLLAAFVYRDSDAIFQKSLRLLFWGAIFTSMVLALRERRLTNIVSEKHETAGTRELFTGDSLAVQGIQSNAEGKVEVGIVEQYPGQVTGASAPAQVPLLTRAGTSVIDAERPLISDAQLEAVVNRRGYAMVRNARQLT